MKVNSFTKDLNRAKKDYPQIANVIIAYETGHTTFKECLQMIYEVYSEESAKAAIEYWRAQA